MARVLQLAVTLNHVEPPVWRRLLVPEELTLAQLHAVLQVAMGWDDCHLHAFTIQGQRFSLPSPDDFIPVVDERKHRIGALVHKGHKLTYAYDFGDGWEHTVVVENIREASPDDPLPSCLDGLRACPPEDCGGPHAYADLLAALADPGGDRHRELVEWIGGAFDAERFDREAVNAALAALFRPRPRRAPGKAAASKRAKPKPAKKKTLH